MHLNANTSMHVHMFMFPIVLFYREGMTPWSHIMHMLSGHFLARRHLSKYSLLMSSNSECGENDLQNNKDGKSTIKKEPNSESDSELDDPKSKDRLPKLPTVKHGESKNKLSQEEYDYIWNDAEWEYKKPTTSKNCTQLFLKSTYINR